MQSFLVVLNIVLLLLAIRGVTRNPRLSNVAKVAWVAAIVIAPFLGSIAYLVYANRASGRAGPGRPAPAARRPGWFFER